MPVSADPNKTFDYWLDSDVDKPIESRPVLIFRHPTRRQRTRAIELRAEAIRIGSGDDAWNKVHESIGVCLVGWRNQSLPPADFALDRLADIFDDGDILETMGQIKPDGTFSGWLSRASIAADELRFFVSPAPDAQAQSAKLAAENAPTDPETVLPKTTTT